MKKIHFIPNVKNLDAYCEPPTLSKNVMPSWYKDAPSQDYKNPKFDFNGNIIKNSIKLCMPFMDSITSGYIQKTWTEISIYVNDGGHLSYSYSSQPEILGVRDNVNIELDDSFYHTEFTWKSHWSFKVPKGYSVLVTHPLNRIDLPFQTLSGIVDSDNFFHNTSFGGSLPFYIKKGFTGIIPVGTPMYQIIPFKRDSWVSGIKEYNEREQLFQISKLRRKFWGGYKNEFWKKKEWS
jgi:hypothetical protein